MRRSLVPIACLVAGLIIGIVITGRSASTDQSSSVAPSAYAQGRGIAQLPAASGSDLSSIAERAVKSTVNIAATQTTRIQMDPFFQMFTGQRDRVQRSQSLGSGVIVSADGYLLTNNHVVGEAANGQIDIKVTLPDNRELPGKIVGVDELTDLAVVKVDAQDLPTLPWGDSSKLRLAEPVLAIGSPFGLSQTVTAGIVSSVSRPGAQLGAAEDFIQTDAAINPGNSGGALINTRGELVGINSMIYSETGGYQGIGFAIPANQARRIMDELIKNGHVTWGSIGAIDFESISNRVARQLQLNSTSGAWVYALATNSPAAHAGLQEDDVVVAYNGKSVDDVGSLERLIAESPIGSTAKLDVIREGRHVAISVTVTSSHR